MTFEPRHNSGPAASRLNAARGFTFIELACTLSIIVVLMAFLSSVMVRSREAARRSSCASNLAQIGTALRMYAQDNDGHLPPAEHWENLALSPYVRNTGVFVCPSSPKAPLPDVTFSLADGKPASTTLPVPTSYAYRGGYSSDDWGDLPVLRDRDPWHQEGGNLLHLDGSVLWAPKAKLPDLSKPTDTTESLTP